MEIEKKNKTVEKEAQVPSPKEFLLKKGIGLGKDCDSKGMFNNKILLKVVGDDIFAVIKSELNEKESQILNSIKKEENK